METGVSCHLGPLAPCSAHDSIRPLLAKRGGMNDRVGTMNQVQCLMTSGVPDKSVPNRSLIPTATPSMKKRDDSTLGVETGVSHHPGPVAGSENDLIRPLLAKRRMNVHDCMSVVMETGVTHHPGPVAGSENDLIRPLLAKIRMDDRDGITIVIVIQDQYRKKDVIFFDPACDNRVQ
eukprot:scaffold136224_cov35-Attheya_sp.AAC.1